MTTSAARRLGAGVTVIGTVGSPEKMVLAKKAGCAHVINYSTENFTQRVKVSNRDELGALAANVNRMSEQLGDLYQQLETASEHEPHA